jgi:ribose transport system substrate-binding protein
MTANLDSQDISRRTLLRGTAIGTAGSGLGLLATPKRAVAAQEEDRALPPADPNETYVMVTFLSGIEFWVPARRGMEEAAALFGVSASYQGTPEYDAQAEATVLDQVIATNPAGLIVTAQNPEALAPSIDRAIDQGIALVMFDSDSPMSKRPSIVAVDNRAGGASAARFIGEAAGGSGSVAIITKPGQFNLDQRQAGFEETLAAEFPEMSIAGVSDALGFADRESQAGGAFIQANPDLVGMFSTGSTGVYNAVPAVKEAGKLDQLTLVSFDIDQALVEGIQSGDIDATVVQGAYNMGFWAMIQSYMLKHGLDRPVADYEAAGISPLPPYTDAGVFLATSENIEYFAG